MAHKAFIFAAIITTAGFDAKAGESVVLVRRTDAFSTRLRPISLRVAQALVGGRTTCAAAG